MKPFIIIPLLFLFVFSVVSAFGDGPIRKLFHKEKQPGTLVLPQGRVAEGKVLFEAKQCHRCHTVNGSTFAESVLPSDLVIHLAGKSHKGWTRDHFGSAIMNPQHGISPQYQKAKAKSGDKLGTQESPMPDYRNVLTLGDMIDIANYLDASLRKQ